MHVYRPTQLHRLVGKRFMSAFFKTFVASSDCYRIRQRCGLYAKLQKLSKSYFKDTPQIKPIYPFNVSRNLRNFIARFSTEKRPLQSAKSFKGLFGIQFN